MADETDIITEPESSTDAGTPTAPAAVQPAATLDSIVPEEVAADAPSAELKAIPLLFSALMKWTGARLTHLFTRGERH